MEERPSEQKDIYEAQSISKESVPSQLLTNLPSKNSEEKSISSARWLDNSGEEVEEVFGFNQNAELVNGRTAMVGFLMLILTELVFRGAPVTKAIFGIG